MKKILFSLFVVMSSILLYAQQSGIVSGKVTDEESDFSLPGATVQLIDDDLGKKESNRYTISDEAGSFRLLNVPVGTYTLHIRYMGYKVKEQKLEVKNKENTVVNIALASEGKSLQGVVIRGDRAKGQILAMNRQRNNANITNVISADQMGRFPDANIGDAVKRVPGITMQNDQGEARNIIIRGLAPALNSVTINGDRLPSAEGDNRNVQMDLIPAEMIASVEVNKTLTSDMDADAIGGSVNLATRATPNARRISATAALGYASIRNKLIFPFSFIYGDRFFKKKFGVSLSGSYNNINYGSDNIEATWKKDDLGNVYTEQQEIRRYDVQRIRRSLSFSSDYKWNENNTIFFNAIYNWRDDRENRYRTRYNLDPIYDNSKSRLLGYEGRVRRQTKGGIDNDRSQNRRLEDQRTQSYSLKGEHLLNPKLNLDWSISYAQASEHRPNERYIEFEQKGLNFTTDFSNPSRPYVKPIGDSLHLFKQKSPTENNNYTDETEITAKANIRFPFSVIKNQKGRIRTGARVRIKEKMRNNIFYSYKPKQSGTLASLPHDNYDGEGFNPGSKYEVGPMASASYLGSLNLYDANAFTEKLEPSEFLGKNYRAKEHIYAVYVRWDQDITSKLSFIAGLRVENTHIDYTANRVKDEETLEGIIENTNNYTNFFPNLSLKYNATKDLILRAAFTTSLARPNYYDLAPYVDNVAADTKINVGNSKLNATYAYNVDLMAENYFKSVGLVSAGFFFKNLNDYIYTYQNSRYTSGDFARDFSDQSNPIPAGEIWRFKQPRNGTHVNLYGFEVSFQRQLDFLSGFLKYFEIYLNYTYTHSEAKGIASNDGEERNNIGLPGAAPHIANASLSWENKRFSARLSLNYTSDYIDELGEDAFNDAYYGEQLFLDANASFKIIKRLRVFAELNNLTNQPLHYYQGVSSRVRQLEFYERRYTMGVKFNL